LLGLIERLEFGPKWREWISIALATASPRFLLNGAPGPPIKHHRGLHQGDPLSTMHFILVMDPLQKILSLVIEKSLLHPVAPRSVGIKASLYVDDAALFIHPCSEDVATLKEILMAFSDATGILTNMQKT
jgi:hypothetical protein